LSIWLSAREAEDLICAEAPISAVAELLDQPSAAAAWAGRSYQRAVLRGDDLNLDARTEVEPLA
jgi:hypothetical protein